MIITLDSPAVLHLKKRDRRLAAVIDAIGAIECREHPDAFAFIAKEIVEQMLSIRAADCIRGRIAAMAGGGFTPGALLRLTPDDLRAAGMSRNKAGYLLGFASAVADGTLDLGALPSLSDEEVVKRLTSLRGIGAWTAKMYLLFVLGRDDVLPHEDAAFMQSFRWLCGLKAPSLQTVISRCRKWKPYSSVAARYLYRALDTGMTKSPLALPDRNISGDLAGGTHAAATLLPHEEDKS